MYRILSGSIFLVICIIVYVFQVFRIKTTMNEDGFSQPYFVLYFSHSFLAFLVPMILLYDRFKCHSSEDLQQRSLEAEEEGTYGNSITSQKDQQREPSDRDSLMEPLDHSQVDGVGYAGIKGHFDRMSLILDPENFEGNKKNPWFQRYGKVFSWLFWLSLMYTFPSYLWYVALDLTLVSKVTVIFNSYCLFTFIFSVLLLGDRVTLLKSLGCGASVLGVALLSLPFSGNCEGECNGTPAAKNDILGMIIAAVAAATYGLYLVMYKRTFSNSFVKGSFAEIDDSKEEEDDEVCDDNDDNDDGNHDASPATDVGAAFKDNNQLKDQKIDKGIDEQHHHSPHPIADSNEKLESLYQKSSTSSTRDKGETGGKSVTFSDMYSSLIVTGWLGVFTLIFHWIFFPVLHLTGFERFQLPSLSILLSLCLNGATTFTYNTFYMLSIVMLSPLFCSVTILITIPASILAEHFLGLRNGSPDQNGDNMKQIFGFVILLLAIWCINRNK